jgi:hypothetical protein
MLEKGEPFPAHCALAPGLSRLLSSSICMKHHTRAAPLVFTLDYRILNLLDGVEFNDISNNID